MKREVPLQRRRAGFNQTRSVQLLEKMNGISRVPRRFLLKWMKDTWGLLKISGWAFRDPAVFQHCVLGVCNGEPEEMDICVPFSRGPLGLQHSARCPMLCWICLWSIWLGSLGRSDFFSMPLLYKQEVYFIKIAWILPLLFLVQKILEKSFSQWLPQATRDSFASPPFCCPAHRFSHIHTNTNSCEFPGVTSASHGVGRSVLSLQHIRRNLFIFLNTSVQSWVLDNVLWC